MLVPLVPLVLVRRLHAQTTQTFSGPMEQDSYRPVKLAAKAGASPSMTDAQRDDLEHSIKCQCGCPLDIYTCRTTDFSCSVSPAMHGDVMSLVSGGYGAREILAAFQSVYGERVLMSPVKSGFNWLGYTLPSDRYRGWRALPRIHHSPLALARCRRCRRSVGECGSD